MENVEVRPQWSAEKISAAIAQHEWYHKIDLGQGVVTPGLDFEEKWKMIRRTRDHIPYGGKKC